MQVEDLEKVLRDRAEHALAGSYSATLLSDPERVSRKIIEEAYELCLELNRAEVDQQRVVSEAADVVFHLLAGLVGAHARWEDVLAELTARRRAGSEES